MIKDYLNAQVTGTTINTLWQNQPQFETQLTEFKSVNKGEVKPIVLKLTNNIFELDPILTTLLRECIGESLPLLTQITTLYINLGDVTKSVNKAIITPLLKKLGLDHINNKKISLKRNLSHFIGFKKNK